MLNFLLGGVGVRKLDGTDGLRVGVHISEELTGLGEGRVDAELDSLIHLLLGSSINGADVLLGGKLVVEQPGLDLVDGVTLSTDGRDLLTGTVGDTRVTHGVADITVGVHLHHVGAIALPDVVCDECCGCLHGKGVHTINLFVQLE